MRKSRFGRVFWLTGLPSAGKTSVGRILAQQLRGDSREVVFLDGDSIRELFDDDLGHQLEDRRVSALRNARLCKGIALQGFDVVCATISMFHEVRAWNRAQIERYIEIYLRVPEAELHRRDAKKLYARALRGEIDGVVGVDLPWEEPNAPDLVIDNWGDGDAESAVRAILANLPPDASLWA